eukprot:gnl/TRDRNA2_/TRDRNA2_121000_c0_seq1.p2 gnl/TRDRNA2_/TRDRNA2_121000_c0~~gnl/TRDRNA2_/TRDRNA2_121000_c0_seq1.p2  ORF type:complete len:137 (-),score=14.04 gnl/TRDRNA2_/TRDRNA2_121000_c0_seq1:161-529(-)
MDSEPRNPAHSSPGHVRDQPPTGPPNSQLAPPAQEGHRHRFLTVLDPIHHIYKPCNSDNGRDRPQDCEGEGKHVNKQRQVEHQRNEGVPCDRRLKTATDKEAAAPSLAHFLRPHLNRKPDDR